MPRVLLIDLLLALVACTSLACGHPQDTASQAGTVQPHQGDLATHAGTATVRKAYLPVPDDPATTNDESNDQSPGHFGTLTMIVSQVESGHTYTLDVELDGTAAKRIYFPKGGWVDLEGCELNDDLTGECQDENGKHWTFESVKDDGNL